MGNEIGLLSAEFRAVAVTLGMRIVGEMHLPNDQRLIPELLDAGGIAGGQKYKAGGIFFKFSKDDKGLYGGIEHAMKVRSL